MKTSNHDRAFEMNALIFCQDNLFLPTMNRVLSRLGLGTDVTADYDRAIQLIAHKKIDAIVIDWQEVTDLGQLLESVRNSRINRDIVRVVIARDLMDMTQAFSAGMQFMIHKPASVVQISGCLEAMRGAVLKQRRKNHREPVRISPELSTRSGLLLGATIVNLSVDGFGLVLNTRTCKLSAGLSAGSEIEFSFVLPGTRQLIVGTGIIAWVDRGGKAGIRFTERYAGVQFQCMSDTDQQNLELWLGERFERAMAMLLQTKESGCA